MIEEVSTISEADFKRNYINKGKPVIIRHSTEVAQACKFWSMNYLTEKQPEQQVRVASYEDNKLTLFPLEYLKMTMRKFTELVRKDGNHKKYYLAEANLDQTLPISKNEISIPHFIPKNKLLYKLLFIGIDTLTSAHYHFPPLEALLTQVVGEKKVLLYPAAQYKLLYPFPWYSKYSNWSRVPIDPNDENRLCAKEYPKLKNINEYVVLLGPGESLYIPQGWFHVAQGIGESISVSFFFKGSLFNSTFYLVCTAIAANFLKSTLWLRKPKLSLTEFDSREK
ncbi:cupin-like domain-containing protein [Collimonas fungivorans]|uniref:cupin-like domain-containing protein n=1 Tax=Collimonas fungivorans TaxID=158899 RepID=UPI00077859A8|nr:cupin-like domain-containing protein [Collimonas fungivorans]